MNLHSPTEDKITLTLTLSHPNGRGNSSYPIYPILPSPAFCGRGPGEGKTNQLFSKERRKDAKKISRAKNAKPAKKIKTMIRNLAPLALLARDTSDPVAAVRKNLSSDANPHV